MLFRSVSSGNSKIVNGSVLVGNIDDEDSSIFISAESCVWCCIWKMAMVVDSEQKSAMKDRKIDKGRTSLNVHMKYKYTSIAPFRNLL